jgi:hypothetical protein
MWVPLVGSGELAVTDIKKEAQRIFLLLSVTVSRPAH